MDPTKMKALHIINCASPSKGGPIEGIVRLHYACETLGGERELLCTDPASSAFVNDFPFKVYAVGPEKRGTSILDHYGYTPHFIPWLKENVERFDCVIINGLWNYASFAASMVLPGGKVPYFVFAHGMMDPWFKHTYPLKHIAKQAFWLAAEGRLMAGARSALFTCEEEKLQARNVFWGHKYRETVVSYGSSAPPAETPDQKQAFLHSVPKLNGRPYLLFLSRIHVKKGCDLLIEAFAKVADRAPELDLVMVGPDDTNWRGELEKIAARRGITDRIHWAGPLYGAAKWGALRGADAFILPSHQENFGIVVAEALACGKPVLISDKVNIWREIKAANAGIIAPDTLDGTVGLINTWLEMNEAGKQTMREAGISLFESQFNMDQAGKTMFQTMAEMI